MQLSFDFMISIITFIPSFKINKVNSFPVLTAPFPLILLSNLFIVFEVNLLTSLGKLSLTKWMPMFATALFPKLTN